MRRVKLIVSLLTFVIFTSGTLNPSFAHELPDSLKKKIDRLFKIWDKSGSPGASLIVLKDNSVIYKNGYGYTTLEYDIPITPSTIFHVASVSKQFTAFSIVMLADQGKLLLDDDIRKHLPEVPDFGKTITIRHLAHHISGMRDQWELLAMAGWRLDDVITKEHIMKMVKNQKELNFNPGDEYLYCNTGFTLLAEIVARISGQSFFQWTTENIFEPLGMENTFFYDDHQKVVKNRAYSYYRDEDKKFKKSVLNYANVGATSLFTTVEDLAKWIQNFDNPKVGNRAVIDQMIERGVLNNGENIGYAFGLAIGKYRGLNIISHSGGDAGFRSHLVMFPDQKFAVAILSNLASVSPATLTNQVANIFLSDQFEEIASNKPAKREEIKIDPKILDAYVGKYELRQGFIISITKEEDQLMGQATGQPKFPLFPESETKFFLKVTDAQISFVKESDGKVNKIILHQGGNDLTAKRIIEFKLNLEQLVEFEGTFFSDELGTFYTIVLEDSQLVAQHNRHSDISLTPSASDFFTGTTWWFQRINFIRNSSKKIDGFKLTGGQVRNLKFRKVKSFNE